MRAGLVRVFRYSVNLMSWVKLGVDIHGEMMDAYFGTSVSLSSDCYSIAVGAPWEPYEGKVHVFSLEPIITELNLPTYLPTLMPAYLPTFLPTFLPTYLPTYFPPTSPTPVQQQSVPDASKQANAPKYRGHVCKDWKQCQFPSANITLKRQAK